MRKAPITTSDILWAAAIVAIVTVAGTYLFDRLEQHDIAECNSYPLAEMPKYCELLYKERIADALINLN